MVIRQTLAIVRRLLNYLLAPSIAAARTHCFIPVRVPPEGGSYTPPRRAYQRSATWQPPCATGVLWRTEIKAPALYLVRVWSSRIGHLGFAKICSKTGAGLQIMRRGDRRVL